MTVGFTEHGGPPVIGDCVRISAGAIVVGPITIGDDSLVGAGAVERRRARFRRRGTPARPLLNARNRFGLRQPMRPSIGSARSRRGASLNPFRLWSRPMFARIDHVGLAVEDLDAAIGLYQATYEMQLVHRETVTEQGVEAVLLDVGENHVELLAPLGPDTPVGKFLLKKGPGMHHVAYQVTDIDAALTSLRDAGLRLIDESPRVGIRGSRVAFLHPSASGGVLTEIVEPAGH
ncbi:MAG TPA: methylmalonyl-CoA epimerase [Baekduia sp.]